jgi:dihydrodipicolinate synthase/N-acetylneuraminate lyase
MLLEGIFLPLTTPFHADGHAFLSKLQYNVERYSRTPSAGLMVLGEAGEADALTDAETRAVLKAAMEAAADEKVMVATVGRESVFATLHIAEFAAEAGYDAIAVRGPVFAAEDAMRIETETYFRAVADGASIPVVLVSESGRELSVPAVAGLAEHPNVIGLIEGEGSRIAAIKAATSSVSREVTVTSVFAAATRRMLRGSVAASSANLGGVAVLEARPGVKTRVKRVGFQVLSATTAGMLESWRRGAVGAVPRAGACAPQACCEVWQAFKDGDLLLAEEKQERVCGLAQRVSGHKGIAALKYGVDFNGYYGGRPRLPLLPPTATECIEIEGELAGMRN